jgi:hypothetical protein
MFAYIHKGAAIANRDSFALDDAASRWAFGANIAYLVKADIGTFTKYCSSMEGLFKSWMDVVRASPSRSAHGYANP